MAVKYRTLTYHYGQPIVSIILNRPRVANRVNLAMATELRQTCQRLREEEGARVLVLTGKGSAFSSGRESISFAKRARQGFTALQWLNLHRAASALAGVEIPVIAAINGNALDHGLELALACDLRISTRDVRLGFTDLSRGGIPWDGGTQRLPRLVGRARALEMLLTCRLIDAEEACRAGLVNMVVKPESLMATVEEVAHQIAAGAPIAGRYAKEGVIKGMDMTLEQGLRLEADLNLILQTTNDRAEGLNSFLKKQEPKFRGE